MKIKNGFILRDVGGKTFVVAVGELTKTFNGMITLNETGKFLWERIAVGADIDSLVAALLAEYDVDEATARAAVDGFVAKLIKNGFVE